MSSNTRTQLVKDFERLGRESSTATILFHHTIGEIVGLSPVELKCIDVLSRKGPLTAGEIAAHTHLTTGAITNLVDRLARRGFLRRATDPNDRRKVIVEASLESEAFRQLAPHYDSLAKSFRKLVDQYDDHELQIIHDFMSKTIATMHAEIEKMRKSHSAE